MEIKSGKFVAVCLVLGVLIGSASACPNNDVNIYVCFYGVVLTGYGVENGECVERTQYLDTPTTCDNCNITALVNSGEIRVDRPDADPVICSYGNQLATKRCEAYCLTPEGALAQGFFECRTASAFETACSCDGSCNANNP